MIIGIISVLVGIFFVYDTYRNPTEDKENDIILADFRGYVGGIGFIILGCILIYNYLKS